MGHTLVKPLSQTVHVVVVNPTSEAITVSEVESLAIGTPVSAVLGAAPRQARSVNSLPLEEKSYRTTLKKWWITLNLVQLIVPLPLN